jgi:hypothetical protein
VDKLRKKGAVNLTTSYVVTLVLVLIIIGFSLRFFFAGLEGANDGVDYVDDAQQNQIEDLLKVSTTKKTAIPFNTETIASGGTAHFLLGIRNNLGRDAGFNVQILFDSASDAIPENIGDWYLQRPIELDLEASEVHVMSLPFVAKGAKRGKYVFNVFVRYELANGDYEPYGQHKLTLEIA